MDGAPPRGDIRYDGAMSASELIRLVHDAAPRAGSNATALPGVVIYRADEPSERRACLYDPCLMIAAQGRKTGYVRGQAFSYDPEQLLVLSVPLPLDCVIERASPEEPYLAVKVSLEPRVVREVVLAAGQQAPEEMQAAIRTSPLTDALRASTIRLLRALADERDARVLGPLCVRELYYRVSCGPQGGFLRALALGHSHSRAIARVLRRIHARFDEPFEVAAAAREAHMAVSTFHHAFKAATAMSPLSYVKSIRLHQARSLMLDDGLTAAEASYRVGYNSPSQFSREFKRLFGLPPGAELERLRAELAPSASRR